MLDHIYGVNVKDHPGSNMLSLVVTLLLAMACILFVTAHMCCRQSTAFMALIGNITRLDYETRSDRVVDEDPAIILKNSSIVASFRIFPAADMRKAIAFAIPEQNSQEYSMALCILRDADKSTIETFRALISNKVLRGNKLLDIILKPQIIKAPIVKDYLKYVAYLCYLWLGLIVALLFLCHLLQCCLTFNSNIKNIRTLLVMGISLRKLIFSFWLYMAKKTVVLLISTAVIVLALALVLFYCGNITWLMLIWQDLVIPLSVGLMAYVVWYLWLNYVTTCILAIRYRKKVYNHELRHLQA